MVICEEPPLLSKTADLARAPEAQKHWKKELTVFDIPSENSSIFEFVSYLYFLLYKSTIETLIANETIPIKIESGKTFKNIEKSGNVGFGRL